MAANNILPRALRAADAAKYLGMSKTKFLELVSEERMPKPVSIDRVVLWDRLALDAAFDALAEQQQQPVRSWDKIWAARGHKK